MRLINDISDIERIESSKVTMVKQTCDAANLMLQAADAMRVMADKAGVISFSLISPAVGRQTGLFKPLLSNAIKFSSEGLQLVDCRVGELIPLEARWGDPLTPHAPTPYPYLKFQGSGYIADKIDNFERFQQVDA